MDETPPIPPRQAPPRTRRLLRWPAIAGLALLLAPAVVPSLLEPAFGYARDDTRRIIQVRRVPGWQGLFGGAGVTPLALHCGDVVQVVLAPPARNWPWVVGVEAAQGSPAVLRQEIAGSTVAGGTWTFRAQAGGQTTLWVRTGTIPASQWVDAPDDPPGEHLAFQTGIVVAGAGGCAPARAFLTNRGAAAAPRASSIRSPG